MLKLLYSIVAVIAILFILAMSFISGGKVGFSIAFLVITVVAIINTLNKRKKPANASVTVSSQSARGKAFKSATTIVVIIVASIPVVGIGGFMANCHIQSYKAKKDFRPVQKQFDSVYFIDEATKPASTVTSGGDCFDSRPWVSVSKSQSTDLKTREALTALDTALAMQNYFLAKDNIHYSYTSDINYPTMCRLITTTQITAQDITLPYKTFNITLASDIQACNREAIATKNYDGISIKEISLQARKE